MQRILFAAVLVFSAAVFAAAGEDPQLIASTSTQKWGLAGVPILTYQPETSLGLGGGAILTHKKTGAAPDRPDSFSAFGLVTAKGQSLVFAEPSLYFDRDNWHVEIPLSFRYFPSEFYGIGNKTDLDDEEEFTSRDAFAGLTVKRRVISRLYAGLSWTYRDTEVRGIDPGGLLDRTPVLGKSGGQAAGPGALLEWDSRDSLFYPTRGGFVRFSGGFSREWAGGDFNFDRISVDVRRYFPAADGRVLAVQLIGTGASGEVPLSEYFGLAGLRGILEPRFRDKRAAVGQAEYRYPLRGRWSGAVFAGAGQVAPSGRGWRLDGLKAAAGMGWRYALDKTQKINLRLDLAFGEDGLFPYFQMLEAF